MKERPILFSSAMVRALLDDRKTMTRRVVKDTLEHKGPINPAYLERWETDPGWASICPYGQPGDRLWVRETYGISHAWDPWPVGAIPEGNRRDTKVYFAATEDLGGLIRRPSIFMPRWASRITLEITAVRVERIQDISDEDCEREGVRPSVDGTGKDWRDNENGWHRTFRQLWDSLNAKRGHGWDVNPWVWVISFKRVE